jgi:hypothetical protein
MLQIAAPQPWKKPVARASFADIAAQTARAPDEKFINQHLAPELTHESCRSWIMSAGKF